MQITLLVSIAMASMRHPCFGLPERLGYVQCNFCTTILLVSVPCGSLLKVVAVQCGHCAGLLSVSLSSPPLTAAVSVELPLQELGVDPPPRECSDESSGDDEGEKLRRTTPLLLTNVDAPMRRQRTPSAYNCFIKEEIKRIKSMEPNITHKEAFSTAAKNWAHLPGIQQKGD